MNFVVCVSGAALIAEREAIASERISVKAGAVLLMAPAELIGSDRISVNE
jgi:hypothetical protein